MNQPERKCRLISAASTAGSIARGKKGAASGSNVSEGGTDGQKLAATATRTASPYGTVRSKPGGHVGVAFVPPAEATAPGATATAELRLRPEVGDVAEIEVTLTSNGQL